MQIVLDLSSDPGTAGVLLVDLLDAHMPLRHNSVQLIVTSDLDQGNAMPGFM